MKKRGSRLNLHNTGAVRSVFDALNDDNPQSSSAQSSKIPLAKIQLPESQPRKYFDPEKLKQLVESIRKDGILQPLLVRPKNGLYELVAGERRYRAAKELKLSEVPVNIREMNDEEAQRYALVENLQREDLNPVEETQAILDLLAMSLKKTEKGTIALLRRMQDEQSGRSAHNVMSGSDAQIVLDVFQGLGKMTWESFVKNRLGILNLPKNVLEAVQSGKIEYTKGKVIAQVKDKSELSELLSDSIEQKLSLTDIRKEVKKINNSDDESEEISEPSTILRDWSNAYHKMANGNLLEDIEVRKKVDLLLERVEKILGIHEI